MLKGKNILYGSGLYLAAIWALYNQKKVTYKDQKELEASVPLMATPKSTKGKDAFTAFRGREWQKFQGTEKYKADPKSFEEFGKSYVKLGYVR